MTQSRFVLQVNWRSDFVYDERFFRDVFDQDIMHVWIARNSHTHELMGYAFTKREKVLPESFMRFMIDVIYNKTGFGSIDRSYKMYAEDQPPYKKGRERMIEQMKESYDELKHILHELCRVIIFTLNQQLFFIEMLIALRYLLENMKKTEQNSKVIETLKEFGIPVLNKRLNRFKDNHLELPSYKQFFSKPQAGGYKEYVKVKSTGRKYKVVIKDKRKYIKMKNELVPLGSLRGNYAYV
jgi:hypothetical protein